MWPMAEKIAGLCCPRTTARRSSLRASSALPSRWSETAVARERERPPLSSASPDPFAILAGLAFAEAALPTTERRGEAPISTGFRFTELMDFSLFLSRYVNLIDYDSFGTKIEHSLPKKSLFLVTFSQYTRAFSLPSLNSPTPPDLRRSSLHESTTCPSIEVRNRLPFTSTDTR